jgi:hypothetical protein
MENSVKRFCIFCGSNYGRQGIYRQEAIRSVKYLAQEGFGLVYGGSSVGLMDEVANTALACGAEVIGVIPGSLADAVGHKNLIRLIIAESMHERKQTMFNLSDGFIALPGGLGTLEEIFELLTWSQLGFHQKPCGFLNIGRFYDRLFDFLDYAAAEQFIKPSHRDMILVSASIESLVQKFEAYEAPLDGKWMK